MNSVCMFVHSLYSTPSNCRPPPQQMLLCWLTFRSILCNIHALSMYLSLSGSRFSMNNIHPTAQTLTQNRAYLYGTASPATSVSFCLPSRAHREPSAPQTYSNKHTLTQKPRTAPAYIELSLPIFVSFPTNDEPNKQPAGSPSSLLHSSEPSGTRFYNRRRRRVCVCSLPSFKCTCVFFNSHSVSPFVKSNSVCVHAIIG